jgi:hypothetical protein
MGYITVSCVIICAGCKHKLCIKLYIMLLKKYTFVITIFCYHQDLLFVVSVIVSAFPMY